ncbi:heterokaryon incompatibility protein-domain-containing protein [Cladorrhinum sp. PSN259]|nr:heterokaryon incompatibility protein-domain-containing protein [Cladorrhinum sp. PSN259]
MTLCEQCQRFDVQEFARVRSGRCGYPVRGLFQAAESGCLFCGLVAEQLRNSLPRHVYTSISAPSFLNYIWPRWVDFLAIRGLAAGEEANGRIPLSLKQLTVLDPNRSFYAPKYTTPIHLHLAAEKGTPASTSNDITGSIMTEPLSFSDMPAIKAWYEHCYRYHEECRLTLSRTEEIDQRNTPLPARLVKVDVLDSGAISFALCETEGTCGKYIALTHRWDDLTHASRTTKSNYQGPVCGSGGEFPKLYRDSGFIAHHLGIKYLWIDSLCIVQDDPEDWRRESVRMADYYQRAWLTIASTTTSDDGGLFGTRLQPDGLPAVVRLPYRDRTGEKKGYFYVQASEPSETARDYTRAVVDSKLLGRGWVFQEFKLSRRLLTFSKRGAYMMCRTKAPENLRGDSVDAVRLFRMTKSLDSILDIWGHFMEQYCLLEFTEFEKDRLVALSGVADEFKRSLRAALAAAAVGSDLSGAQVQFAYGHWLIPSIGERTVLGLLWQEAECENTSREEQHPRLRAMGVPTWSWAAMARRVKKTGKLAGLGVQWYSSRQEYADPMDEVVCQLAGLPLAQCGSINVVKSTTEEPLFMPSREYSNHSSFKVLQLRARLLKVRIHEYFPTDDERKAAANLTYRLPKTAPAAKTWRRVTALVGPEPQFIIGWASVEHARYHRDINSIPDTSLDDDSVYALFVRKLSKIAGGYGWGNWTNHQTAFEVLYVTRADHDGCQYCYERVGIGRLFGGDVEACYAAAEEMDVMLG